MNRLVSVLLPALLASSLGTPALAQSPLGHLDGVTPSGVAVGWAFDSDAPSASLDVHIYVDGPYGTGTFVAGAKTEAPRPDISTAYGVSGNHGFEFTLPSSVRDGRPHTLFVYALNVGPGQHTLLGGSGAVTFTLGSAPPPLPPPPPPPPPSTLNVLRVADYGAIPDDGLDDGPAIRQAVAAASDDTTIQFAPGTYDLSATSAQGIKACVQLRSVDRVVLQGQQTLLRCRDPLATVLAVFNSSRVTVKGLRLDYDPLPFTQGTIVATQPDAGSFDLRLDAGYSLLDAPRFAHTLSEGAFGLLFAPGSKRQKPGVSFHLYVERWQLLSQRTYRLWLKAGDRSQIMGFAAGDRYVQLARDNGGFYALQFKDCRDSLVQDVTVHASPSVAVLLHRSSGMTVRRLRVTPPAGSDRLCSTDGDAVHCPQNRDGPLIEDSLFERMADDGVNIYCSPNFVREVRSPTQLLLSAATWVQAGDRVQVFNPRQGVVFAQAKVTQVTVEAGQYYLVTLDRPVSGVTAGPGKNADSLYDLDASGEGYVIRDNVIRDHRGRGLILKGGRGLVTGNTLRGQSFQGIAIMNNPDWAEGPIPSDVRVEGNVISNTNLAGILVMGKRLGGVAQGRIVRRISVRGNTIKNWGFAGIQIAGAQEVSVQDNLLTADWVAWPYPQTFGIYLDNVGATTLAGNRIRDSRASVRAGVLVRNANAPGDVVLSGNTFTLPPGVPSALGQ